MSKELNKARGGNKEALLGIISSHLNSCTALAQALLASCEAAEAVAVAALDSVLEAFYGGAFNSEAELLAQLTYKTVSLCRSAVLKQNQKAFKSPQGKNFAISIPAESNATDLTSTLALLPALHRFIFVLPKVTVYDEKKISDIIGISIESVKAATAVEEENVRKLSAVGAKSLDEQMLQAFVTDYSVSDGEQKRINEVAQKHCAPAMAKTSAAAKKNLVFIAALAGVVVLAVIAAFLISGIIKNTSTTSGNGTSSGGSEIFDDVTVDMNKTYYADITIRDYGTIRVRLNQSAAPITVSNFVNLANSKFYDGKTFHRIIEGFMMQGGSSDGLGYTGSDQCIKGEFASNGISNPISHKRGVISMARAGYSMDSASSQFFIMHKDYTDLDGDYAAFGEVVTGMDIVDRICEEAEPVDSNGKIPASAQPVIESVRIIVN